MKNEYYYAIDQSFNSTGSIIFDSNSNIIFADRYSSDKEQDFYFRCWEVATHISEIANEYKPAKIILEQLAYNSFGDQTRNLAGLLFVVTCVLRYVHNFETELVVPTVVKKYATGAGNASKKLIVENLPKPVLNFFTESMGLKKTTGLYDLADAYWIGRHYLDNVRIIE